MLFYVTNLPHMELTREVNTLLTVQICKRKFGELSMTPLKISAEEKPQWTEVIKSLITTKRMSSFYSFWLKHDPILPKEIRVCHLPYRLRRIFQKALTDSTLVQDNMYISESYFCFNQNHHKYITSSNCEQHIDLTIKLEERYAPQKTEIPTQPKTEISADEVMVIKVEPDF